MPNDNFDKKLYDFHIISDIVTISILRFCEEYSLNEESVKLVDNFVKNNIDDFFREAINKKED